MILLVTQKVYSSLKHSDANSLTHLLILVTWLDNYKSANVVVSLRPKKPMKREKAWQPRIFAANNLLLF